MPMTPEQRKQFEEAKAKSKAIRKGQASGKVIKTPLPEDAGMHEFLETASRNVVPDLEEIGQEISQVPEAVVQLGEIIGPEMAQALFAPTSLVSDPPVKTMQFVQDMAKGTADEVLEFIKDPKGKTAENPVDALMVGLGAVNAGMRAAGKQTISQSIEQAVKRGVLNVSDAVKFPEKFRRVVDLLEEGAVGIAAFAPNIGSGFKSGIFAKAYHANRISDTRYKTLVDARTGKTSNNQVMDRLVLAHARSLDRVKARYGARLEGLDLKDPDIPLDIEKALFDGMDDIEKEFRFATVMDDKGKIHVVPAEGFSTTPFGTNTAAKKQLEEFYEYLVDQAGAKNNNIQNIDMIKRAAWESADVGSEAGNVKMVNDIKKHFFDRTREHLRDRVKDYKEITGEYDNAIDRYSKIEDMFSLQKHPKDPRRLKNPDAAFTKLQSIYTDTKATTAERLEILEELSAEIGIDIEAGVAGMMASTFEPKGLVARAGAVAVGTGFGPGGGEVLAAIPMMIPRAASSIFGNAGLGVRKFGEFSDKILIPLHKHVTSKNLVFEGMTYADAARMITMSDGEARMFQEMRASEERNKKSLGEMNLPQDVLGMLQPVR